MVKQLQYIDVLYYVISWFRFSDLLALAEDIADLKSSRVLRGLPGRRAAAAAASSGSKSSSKSRKHIIDDSESESSSSEVS